MLLTYIGQNVCYSLYLKRFPYVDILVIAVGFVLRAVAGVVVISVSLSHWLIITTFYLALVLALGKRRSEIQSASVSEDTRSSLDEYSEKTVDQMLTLIMAALLVSYSMYTMLGTDSYLFVTLPFVCFGLFRHYHIVYDTEMRKYPHTLFTDVPSLLNIGLWTIVTMFLLYDGPAIVTNTFL